MSEPNWSERRYDKDEAAALAKMWSDYHDANAKMQVKHDPDEPEPGYKRMSWKWPAAWGEPIERSRHTSPWGRKAEGLLFKKQGWVNRLTEGVNGYDP